MRSLRAVEAETLIKKPDSLSRRIDSIGSQTNNIDPHSYNEITRLTGHTYFILPGSNIKQSFTKPFHMTRKDRGRLGKFALAGGGLSFADESIQRNAPDLRNRSKAVRETGKYISNIGFKYEIAALAGFGA